MTRKNFATHTLVQRDNYVPGAGLPRARRLSLIFACLR